MNVDASETRESQNLFGQKRTISHNADSIRIELFDSLESRTVLERLELVDGKPVLERDCFNWRREKFLSTARYGIGTSENTENLVF